MSKIFLSIAVMALIGHGSAGAQSALGLSSANIKGINTNYPSNKASLL